jgi:hypothetical protein
MKWVVQAKPYAPMAIQFLLGGLFSAYAIFYSKSATFAGTAVFFCLLVAFLVANEFLRSRLVERAAAGESLRPRLFRVLHLFSAGDDRLDECRRSFSPGPRSPCWWSCASCS